MPRRKGQIGIILSDTLDLTSRGTSLADQLREALAANLGRTIDLFREWDADGSGWVDKAEFARAVSLLGLVAERDASDALFDELDDERAARERADKQLAQALGQG